MVCGSGNAYCATVQFSGSVQTSSDSDSSDSECPDIAVETMMLLEDFEGRARLPEWIVKAVVMG